MRLAVVIFTSIWFVLVLMVGAYWLRDEYKLIAKDNGDGTVTFQDGPDQVTQSKDEFRADAIKHTLVVVAFFPTLPYLAVMAVVGVVWLATRSRGPDPDAGWGASGDNRRRPRARLWDGSARTAAGI